MRSRRSTERYLPSRTRPSFEAPLTSACLFKSQALDGAARGKLPLALPLIRQRPGGSVLLRRPTAKVGQHSTGVDTRTLRNSKSTSKAHPDQIPLVLPDFKPWSHYPAIQTFYALLTWLNGPDSIFESNDCGLRAPRRDNDTPEIIRRAFDRAFDADPIVMHGRLNDYLFATLPGMRRLRPSMN